MDTLSAILENKLVAIIRGAHDIPAVVEALYAGGVRVIEITLNSPDPFRTIADLNHTWGDQLLVGAGTVLTVDDAKAAVHAGARFLISPHFDPAIIAATHSAGAISIPGAYTPTEIIAAHRAGADIVKVFPASPAYFRDLKGPLSHIPMMPTGGVTLENIREFYLSGAVAFGVGSALVGAGNATDAAVLTARAESFIEAIQP